MLAALVIFAVWLQVQLGQGERGEPASNTGLERYLLRHKLRLVDSPRPSDDVVVVSFGPGARKLLGPYPPWPRDVYADLIARLRQRGARTIVLDLLLADPQLRFMSPSAFRSLVPELPLEKICIVNHARHVQELAGKLSKHQRELERVGGAAEVLRPAAQAAARPGDPHRPG